MPIHPSLYVTHNNFWINWQIFLKLSMNTVQLEVTPPSQYLISCHQYTSTAAVQSCELEVELASVDARTLNFVW
jgi:hypothetical protein